MNLSSQQKAILEWVESGSGSLIVEAFAGCGKTTTIMEVCLNIVNRNAGTVWIGAYNKAIATELKARLEKAGVDWKQASAGTLHAAGFGALKKIFPHTQVDGQKMKNLIFDHIATHEALLEGKHYAEELRGYQNFIQRIVSLAKQQAAGFLWPISDDNRWFNIVEHFGLEEDLAGHQSIEIGVAHAREFLELSTDLDHEVIDFDDMIFSPLFHNVRLYPKDWVLIDEAQDTNPARRALAIKMLKPGTGRLIAVGDPHQAIYGFTGADSDALDIIRQELGASTLPLSETYRCPKAIVDLAHTWVPGITALDSAPEGKVFDLPLDAPKGEDDFLGWAMDGRLSPSKDVVLCRNVKPLIELAFGLIKRSVGCKVEGRDIGQGLIKLVNRFPSSDLPSLLDELGEWAEKEIQKWQAKGKESRAAQIEDQVQSLFVVGQALLEKGESTKTDLIAFINDLFSDTNGAKKVITLSTVHKSKGREWDRVFLLGRNKFMPSKWARKEWQVDQEMNLCYVAVTRSKNTLVEIIV